MSDQPNQKRKHDNMHENEAMSGGETNNTIGDEGQKAAKTAKIAKSSVSQGQKKFSQLEVSAYLELITLSVQYGPIYSLANR